MQPVITTEVKKYAAGVAFCVFGAFSYNIWVQRSTYAKLQLARKQDQEKTDLARKQDQEMTDLARKEDREELKKNLKDLRDDISKLHAENKQRIIETELRERDARTELKRDLMSTMILAKVGSVQDVTKSIDEKLPEKSSNGRGGAGGGEETTLDYRPEDVK